VIDKPKLQRIIALIRDARTADGCCRERQSPDWRMLAKKGRSGERRSQGGRGIGRACNLECGELSPLCYIA
jgi:hypothetical protein